MTQTAKGWSVNLHVKTGEPVRVRALKIDLPDEAREQRRIARAIADFAPQPGGVFDSSVYEKSKTALQTALLSSGYLDAAITTSRVEVTRETNVADITLQWDSGTHYRFGPVNFIGSQIDEDLLRRYLPWEEGDFYTQNRLLRFQQRLADTDYFGIVDVMPNQENVQGDLIPIDVTLSPAKRNVYTAGIFMDTNIGAGVKGSMTRRWVNESGHKLRLQTELAQREKTLSAAYTIPLPGENDRSYSFGAIYVDQNTATSTSNTLRLTANEAREWQGFTRKIGVNLLTGTYTVAATDGSSTLVYPEITLEKKQRTGRSTALQSGYSMTLTARASPGPSTNFAQLRGDGQWIQSMGENARFLVRGTLGATSVSNFDKLPPELRFFAGGDRSIRGYGYQTIGPPLPASQLPAVQASCLANPRATCDNLVIGGKFLATINTEYERYFTKSWGAAVFVDAGDAFSRFGDYKTHVGAGAGLRWRSPVGLVRVDVGMPIKDPEGRTGARLHLMIGADL
jgi:translocation and assembly module TamA